MRGDSRINPGMQSTWRHRWNRLFRRRGALPRSARLPRRTYSPIPRTGGAFARPRLGRFGINFHGKRWGRRVALGVLAAGAIWVLWQSWVGLGVFNH